MNNLRIIPVTLTFIGNDLQRAFVPIGTKGSFLLRSMTEYHIGVFNFNFRVWNTNYAFIGQDTNGRVQTPIFANNGTVFTVDPVNALTEAKFNLPDPLNVPNGSGLEVVANDLSGSANTVVLTLQLEPVTA